MYVPAIGLREPIVSYQWPFYSSIVILTCPIQTLQASVSRLTNYVQALEQKSQKK